MMSDMATQVRITGEEMAPGVWKDNWLPDIDVFPELTQLRETLDRVKAHWHACGVRTSNIKDRMEESGKQRETTMRDAVLAGTDPKLKDDSAALKKELEEAEEQQRAAGKAYVEQINICVATVAEKRSEWLETIESQEAEIAAAAAELQAQLREALGRRGAHQKLYTWIERTDEAAGFPALHIPYGSIPTPLRDEQDRHEFVEQAMLDSYAGGMGGPVRIPDAASLLREQGSAEGELSEAELASAEADLAPSPEVVNAAAQLRSGFAGMSGVVHP